VCGEEKAAISGEKEGKSKEEKRKKTNDTVIAKGRTVSTGREILIEGQAAN